MLSWVSLADSKRRTPATGIYCDAVSIQLCGRLRDPMTYETLDVDVVDTRLKNCRPSSEP